MIKTGFIVLKDKNNNKKVKSQYIFYFTMSRYRLGLRQPANK
jgi:hypothetical protein